MVAPALLALALGALGVVTASPEGPLLSLLSPSDAAVRIPFTVTCSINVTITATNVTIPATNVTITATNVTITANNRTWPVTLSPDGHQATAEVTVTRKGSVQLGCTVHMGTKKLQTHATIQVSYVPTPLLDVPTAAEAGTELRGSCSLPPGAISDIQVQVVARGQEVLVALKKPPVPFSLRVTEEDAGTGLEVTCEARMDPEPPRNRSQRVRVLVQPRLDIDRCPPQQNWTEGQEGTLTCSARGSPEPQVSCSKDGNSLSPGSARPAARAHAGTYLCRATNALGTAERNVTVWVHYNDNSVPLLPVLLGSLLPLAVLLSLAGLLWYLRHTRKIGEYWLWKRQPPPDVQPLRPQGGSAAAPNGSAAP